MTTTPGVTDDVTEAEFAWLDPRTLTVEANVRTTAALDRAFVASIRQHGVLMPVLVVRDADGALLVRAGQRRTLGAIEAEVATIPARIIPAGPGAERLVQQVIENDQRAGISEVERVAAFEQMHLEFGMSAAQIAGRLSVRKHEVATALRAVTRVSGKAAVAAGLTIDQAASIAAFDHDPAVVERLTRVAQQAPYRLAHEVQRERDALADARARARLIEDLTATGVTVLDSAPAHDDPTTRALYRLQTQDGADLDPAEHAACSGHVAYLITGGWADDYRPLVRYACADFAANGHRVHAWETPTTASPVEDEAAREAKQAERRRVIKNNKAWRSATTVRRDWLKTFAARKSAPKGASALLGYIVTHRHDDLARAAASGHEMARDLLGLTADRFSGRQVISNAIDAATPGRQNVITMTLALAAVEDATDDCTWRHPTTHVARYLGALESWGYTLADIEQQAAGRAPDPTDEPTLGEDESQNGADERPAEPDEAGDDQASRLDLGESGAADATA